MDQGQRSLVDATRVRVARVIGAIRIEVVEARHVRFADVVAVVVQAALRSGKAREAFLGPEDQPGPAEPAVIVCAVRHRRTRARREKERNFRSLRHWEPPQLWYRRAARSDTSPR